MGERKSGSWPTEKARRRGRAPATQWTRWVFLRLLAVVCLAAFWSLDAQVEGLIGPDGLLPLGEHLERADSWIESRRAAGAEVSRWDLPTVFWWRHDPTALHAVTRGGAVLSVLLFCGVAQGPVLVLLWGLYLSLVVAGQSFLGFQWDALLLETLLFAWFVAPWSLRPRAPTREPPPPRLGVIALRFLAFKLMFLSGATKLLSGDETWRALSALDVHYQTQPLPSWISWHVHQLPGWFHRVSAVLMFAVEVVAPLFFFGPRRWRLGAAAATVLLQVGIVATGNYGFFNALALVLCVPLLDDGIGVAARPGAAATRSRREEVGALRRLGRGVGVTVLAVLVAASSVAFLRELVRSAPRAAGAEPEGVAALLDAADRRVLRPLAPTLLEPFAPLRSLNGYGLFRVMTTRRPEIVVEASLDGASWVEMPFRYKPGDPARRPPVVFLHMPRLDWQMWFAALSPRGQEQWLGRLPARLLEGSESVRRLLGEDPFAGRPPRFVRLVAYDYRFSTPEERRESGSWWVREAEGPLTRPLGLDDVGSGGGS